MGYGPETKKRGRRLFAATLTVTLTVISPVLYARDPAVPLIRARSAALVTVQGVSAVGATEHRAALIDKASGRLRIERKKRPLNYGRSGGGVVLSSKGIIVTNAHTVRGASDIFVIFYDGTRASAKLIGVATGDLAFLRVVPPFKLTAVPLADSDKISKGMFVYTRGNTLWHHDTLFRGKVTGAAFGMVNGRPQATLLQTVFGSEFYLGDSGCPVFDDRGNLLGLVIGGRRDGDKAAFSVAANVIKDVYQRITVTPAPFWRKDLAPGPSRGWGSPMKRASDSPVLGSSYPSQSRPLT